MSNITNKIFVDKMGGTQVSDFVGNAGELFYDPNTGVVKISDGVTPGGKSIVESSPLESLYKGDWVYFVRPDDSSDVVDKIAPNLWLARGNGGSLYNAALVDGEPIDQGGEGLSTPTGTQWNNGGWADFSDVKSRYYSNLSADWAGGGWALVKHDYIMHDTENDKYYAIRFLSWDSGNNNATGAFSYIRREINTDIYFVREDTSDMEAAYVNADYIDEGLAITRGTGGPIFNVGFGIRDVWTQFQYSSNDYVSLTWNTDQTVTVVEPSGNMLNALTNLKVGDPITIHNGNGDSSQTVTSVYNPETGTFGIDFSYGSPVDSAYIYMNLPTEGPKELEYDNDESPVGTLWNAEGYDDLSNLKSRQWMVFDDLWAGEQLGKRILGKELVMWDTINNKYYAIKFTRWQKVTGGVNYPGFSYTRRQIDTNKLSAGLKFADGTVQTTAYSEKIAGTLKQAAKQTSQVEDRFISPADIGKVIYLDNSTTNTLRIPDGGTVDFPVGATITIINRTGGNVYLYKENDDENGTIFGAGTSNSGTAWYIPDNGGGNICTLIKISTSQDSFQNDWMLSGANIGLD